MKISNRLQFWIACMSAFTLMAGSLPAARAASLSFRDMAGKTYSQKSISSHKATVFFFLSCQCPLSNLYSPRMESLYKVFSHHGVQFFGIYSNYEESGSAEKKDARDHGLTFPVVRDANGSIAKLLHASYTPESVLVDQKGSIRYRGRIDNKVAATPQAYTLRQKTTSKDLSGAIWDVLEGKQVAHPVLLSFGCAIRRAPDVTASSRIGTLTYAHDIAPILNRRCVECHRAGQVAPFVLTSYKQAAAWAQDIKRYTQNGYMPPWEPTPGYGDFVGEHTYVLTAQEKAKIAKWVDTGTLPGNLSQAPPEPHFPSGWQLGKPDAVYQAESPYHLAADGSDVYRNFVIHTHFHQNVWVRSLEVHPENRLVVHHVIVYIDGFRLSPKMEASCHDGQPGYTSSGGGPGFLPTGLLGGWAPGNAPEFDPNGVAMLIPKNALLVLQVHYHKDGKPETDHTSFGIYFAHHTIQKSANMGLVANFSFSIPPGAAHYKVTAQMEIPQNAHLLNILPHMHLLGQEMKLWAVLPNGTDKPIIWIKHWDFNWQRTYWLRRPMELPKGTIVHLKAYYNNSSSNPFNPHPSHPIAVGFGEETTDEMCLAFLTLTLDNERLNLQPKLPALQQTAFK